MRLKAFRLLSSVCLVLVLLSGMFSVTAGAIEIKPDTYGRVGILAMSDGTRLDNVTFDAWRIGDYDSGTGHGLYDGFLAYGLDPASDNFAAALRDYLIRDGVAPDLKATSGPDGEVAFEGLAMGSYLICAEDFERGDYRYSGVAMLVRLPYLSDGDGNLDIYAELEAKFERRRVPGFDRPDPDGGTITRRVLKVWDDGHDADGRRPGSVRAELLRDGRSYDVRRLSESNGWSYTWYGLDPGYRWTVVEHASVPGYATDIEKIGRTYVLTNSLIPDEPEPEDPVTPVTPVIPVDPADPVMPGPSGPGGPGPEDPGTPVVPGPGSKIPQTGNPMWVVTVLTGVGLVLVLIGWLMWRRGRGNGDAQYGGAGPVLAAAGIVLVGLSFACMLYFQYEASVAGGNMPDLTGYIRERPDAADIDTTDPEADVPDYVLDPAAAMPLAHVDGRDYCGRLDVPGQDLSLPVLSELTYPGLRTAPARYSGSAYDGNFVIGAHNYDRHFGRLKYLSEGDEAMFTDMDGNVFYYNVTAVETLGPYESERLVSDNPGLTLFTCTYGGRNRVVVRLAPDASRTADWSGLIGEEGSEV